MAADHDLADVFSHEQQMRRELLKEAPSFSRAFSELLQPLSVLTAAMFRTQSEALALVTNHIMNDTLDLLRHASAGDGRAALRTARSLFEGMINLQDLYSDISLQQRYSDHEAVTQESLLEVDWGYDQLGGKLRRSASHYKKKAEREYGGATDRMVQRYGPAIRTRWHPKTFKDRVELLGFGPDYSFYRLTSALIHSSSGGALGVLREVDGTRVHRTGPAVSLCPVAVLHGLRYIDNALAVLRQHGVEVPEPTLNAVASLQEAWPEFFHACMAIDQAMWPDERPVSSVGVLVLAAPQGMGSRWLVGNAAVEFAEAFTPTLSDAEQERLQEIVRQIESLTATRTSPVAIAVSFANPLPKPGARWRDMAPHWGGGAHYIADMDKIISRDRPIPDLGR
jgi:hypothetical protein